MFMLYLLHLLYVIIDKRRKISAVTYEFDEHVYTEENSTSNTANADIIDPDTADNVESVANDHCTSVSDPQCCTSCKWKEIEHVQLVEKYEKRITILKQSLKKFRNKANYLKTKMRHASSLEKENLVDEKLLEGAKVITSIPSITS